MHILDLKNGSVVAYFSMEVGIEPSIPTYSGGLGILAGDTLRSGADLKVPMVGISLLHRKGYFNQSLDKRGNQDENPVTWRPEDSLESVSEQVSIQIEGRKVRIRAWRYPLRGISGHLLAHIFSRYRHRGERPRRQGAYQPPLRWR